MISNEQLAELEAKAKAAGSWAVAGYISAAHMQQTEEFQAAASPAVVLEILAFRATLIAEIEELIAAITRLSAKAESDRIKGHILWEQTVYRLEKERDEWRDKAVRFRQIAIQALHHPIPPEYDQVFRDNIDELLA